MEKKTEMIVECFNIFPKSLHLNFPTSLMFLPHVSDLKFLCPKSPNMHPGIPVPTPHPTEILLKSHPSFTLKTILHFLEELYKV